MWGRDIDVLGIIEVLGIIDVLGILVVLEVLEGLGRNEGLGRIESGKSGVLEVFLQNIWSSQNFVVLSRAELCSDERSNDNCGAEVLKN